MYGPMMNIDEARRILTKYGNVFLNDAGFPNSISIHVRTPSRDFSNRIVWNGPLGHRTSPRSELKVYPFYEGTGFPAELLAAAEAWVLYHIGPEGVKRRREIEAEYAKLYH